MQNKKYTTKGMLLRIILLCLWIGLLIWIVDGLGYFPLLEARMGFVVTETLLWLCVLVPAVPVVLYGWRNCRKK